MHLPRATTHLAVFNVVLSGPTARIEGDHDDFPAIRTRHFALGLERWVTLIPPLRSIRILAGLVVAEALLQLSVVHSSPVV